MANREQKSNREKKKPKKDKGKPTSPPASFAVGTTTSKGAGSKK